MSIIVGEKVPNFKLRNQHNIEVSLSDFRGYQVIIYFYEKSFGKRCTTQACDFRTLHNEYKEENTIVVGISTDTVEQHQLFIHQNELPFILLSDEQHEVAELFGVWKTKKRLGREYMGVERSTFMIDEDGFLIYEWRKVSVLDHAGFVLGVSRMHLTLH